MQPAHAAADRWSHAPISKNCHARHSSALSLHGRDSMQPAIQFQLPRGSQGLVSPPAWGRLAAAVWMRRTRRRRLRCQSSRRSRLRAARPLALRHARQRHEVTPRRVPARQTRGRSAPPLRWQSAGRVSGRIFAKASLPFWVLLVAPLWVSE